MKDEKCDHCQEPGPLGREIRAYSFSTPKGKNVVRFLHASDGGRPCYAQYKLRYDAWMSEQNSKAASNG